MQPGFLLITSNTESPDPSFLLPGLFLGIVFFLLGFLIGYGIWLRCHRELNRLDDENRRLSRSARMREKKLSEQTKKIEKLTRPD